MASGGVRQCIRDVTLYLVYLMIISTLGPLQFGFHLAELNAPQDVITCKRKEVAEHVASQPDSNLPQCIPMNEAAFATLSSMLVVGGLIGALFAGPISTGYGRKLAMRITSFFFILGSVLQALAGTVPIMSIGRFLAGIGGGASTVIVPLYISEISPPKERGLFGFMTQVSINIGILLTQTLGFFLSRGTLWRIILGTGAALGGAQFLGLFLVPESPSWLAAHKKPEQAIRTLQRIRGPNTPIADETAGWHVTKPLLEEERLLHEEERLLEDPPSPVLSHHSASSVAKALPTIGFFAITRKPLYRNALIAVIGMNFAQQFCGINAIIMYSVSLLSGPGLLPISSALLTILISCLNLITTLLCAPLPDVIGRKACLLLSISGMGLSSLALSLSLLFSVPILSAISVLTFVGFFATGLGPVPFLIASELVGQEAVGATQSWSLAANYIATYLVAQFFPIVNSWANSKWGGQGWAFLGFAACALASWVFVAIAVPETKGKRDADEVWGRTKVRGVD